MTEFETVSFYSMEEPSVKSDGPWTAAASPVPLEAGQGGFPTFLEFKEK